ncbi:MAG: DUF1501 domain-containing protein [Candidatus Eisenbacteria bacterium]|nr:DUF1501 domain-containing protein [Candidatus Eisenbacteria bacterium]
MKRRSFLRRTLELSAAGLIVPASLRRGDFLDPARAYALGPNDPFAGQILVLINLNGGNDGLNTVVPYNDPTYHAVRPTLAMDPGQVIQIEPGLGTGLHPQLQPLESLYNQGKMAIVQGVGYPNMNLSHFRGTDIWFSGSSEDQVVQTGWLARFLEHSFPEFPTQLPTSPFGLQQSLAHRIPLQGERGVTGVVVDNPSSFYYLVNENYIGDYDDNPPATRGGEELSFLREIDSASFEYAEAIQNAADTGTNTVAYPQTNLGYQLEIVAKLISGGLATPIYLTAEYGFDTHANQSTDHANLMASLAGSVQAFLTDLANQGLAEKVLILTQSEFGRRVEENGGLGTDHGTAAPMFLLGEHVQGGVYGVNPDLINLDQDENLLIQHDYRTIYSSILRQHFGASSTVAQDVLFGDFGTMSLLDQVSAVESNGLPVANRLHRITPNPMPMATGDAVHVQFDLARDEYVQMDVFDVRGRRVRELSRRTYAAGSHRIDWQPNDVASGTYVIRMSTRGWQQSVKAVLVP